MPKKPRRQGRPVKLSSPINSLAIVKAAGFETAAQRDIAMFKAWVDGQYFKDLAPKFGLDERHVAQIARRDRWSQVRKVLNQKRYEIAVESMKKDVADIVHVLSSDLKDLIKARKHENRLYTKDERKHLVEVLEKYLKETRLESDRPTENVNNNHTVRIVVPAGVRHFGVIPSPGGARIEHAKPDKEKSSADKFEEAVKKNEELDE